MQKEPSQLPAAAFPFKDGLSLCGKSTYLLLWRSVQGHQSEADKAQLLPMPYGCNSCKQI